MTLAESVWGDHIDQVDNFDFIYAQVKNLRKKLTEAGAKQSMVLDIKCHFKPYEINLPHPDSSVPGPTDHFSGLGHTILYGYYR